MQEDVCVAEPVLCVCVEQVLEEEEYDAWLKRQLLAESSIENREELLLDSAQRLETNLTLLGRRAALCCRHVEHACVRAGSSGTEHALSVCASVFRYHGDLRQTAGGSPRDH